MVAMVTAGDAHGDLTFLCVWTRIQLVFSDHHRSLVGGSVGLWGCVQGQAVTPATGKEFEVT